MSADSKAEKVVALPGIQLPREQGEPIDRVVGICEELLAEARSGRLRAVAIAKVMAEPSLFTACEFWSGPSPDRYLEMGWQNE